MTTPQAANAATALANTIGRYFTVISVVPSLFFVALVVVLVQSGAWSGTPDFNAGFGALADLGVGGAFALLLGALVLGAVLHPVQFITVQFLEGYWGLGPFWAQIRAVRIQYHMARIDTLQELIDEKTRLVEANIEAVNIQNAGGVAPTISDLDLAIHHSTMTDARRLKAIYPADLAHVMPTRLGNALRAAETRIGHAVDLSILEFAPHLIHLASREQADYVNDQRTSLDLAVRTCLVSGLAFLVMIVFLWPHGLLLLTALVPYVLAWLCYRGSVSAAVEYGAALQMLFDLNRFKEAYAKRSLKKWSARMALNAVG